MVPDLEPMLADRGLPSGDLCGWAAEPKLDGWRVTVLAHPGLPGGVVVRTRRGHVITESLPGIEALARIGRSLVLDGELVAGAGRASEFYALMPRIGGRSGPRWGRRPELGRCHRRQMNPSFEDRLVPFVRPGRGRVTASRRRVTRAETSASKT
jgi:hypothetical protein